MSDFSNFRAVYDELTDEVLRARHQFIREHIRNWIDTIAETSEASRIVRRLENGLDVHEFLQKSSATRSGTGNATLLWPPDKDKRLGMKLLVFREIADGRIEAWRFGHEYMNAGSTLNENAQSFSDQLFSPTARELRRYFESNWNSAQLDQVISEVAPASDRIVRLDHNRPEYRDVMDGLADLERSVRETNEVYSDSDLRQQHTAELAATQRLLISPQVRVAAIVALISGFAIYLGQHLMSTRVGDIGRVLLEKLGILLDIVL